MNQQEETVNQKTASKFRSINFNPEAFAALTERAQKLADERGLVRHSVPKYVEEASAFFEKYRGKVGTK